MHTPTPLLQVDHVTVSFPIGNFLSGGRLVAVNDVSFALDAERPEIYTIAGESGSGKTTWNRPKAKFFSKETTWPPSMGAATIWNS